MRVQEKPSDNKAEGTSRLMSKWMCKKGGVPEKEWDLCVLKPPHLALGISPIWLFPSCSLYNETVTTAKALFQVLELFYRISKPLGGGGGTATGIPEFTFDQTKL